MPLTAPRWDKAFEQPPADAWIKEKKYAFAEKGKGPIYSIDTPPPYVNSPIHIGHAVTYAMMDFFARFKRMTGHRVLFPLGLDRNGLPIEVAAEKKFNVKMSAVPREQFIGMCRQVLEESSTQSIDSFAKLGISFSSWEFGEGIGDAYYTDSDRYRALTQATFIELWKRGLVYEEKRLNNYCPGCRTTIADSEVGRKETETFLNTVKFRVKETGEDVLIATTRPELLCTNAMVIFNPEDTRYAHLGGKTAVTPLTNREVPIVADREADPAFGTGIMYMSASAGDQDALRFLRKRNIEPVPAVGEDGRMLPVSGFLSGLKTKEAREKMIETLREQGLLVKQERIRHSLPICERSKDVIEYIAMPEYYVKQVEFKERIREAAKGLRFFSERSRQILEDWIDSVTMDWAVSRRRVYGTEIPLWYCADCRAPVVPEPGKYVRPWKEHPPVKACPKCKKTEFEPETRVFDTWFDSSVSPLYILHYRDRPDFFKSAYPASLRPQGKEIIRTWLFGTLLRCYQLTGVLPFRDVWINYHILDESGRKMSKSLGNTIDPHTMIGQFGAEAFRLWTAMEGNIAEGDLRASPQRIQGAGKFLNKLWNIARFVDQLPRPKEKPALLPLDAWVLAELGGRAAAAKQQFEQYNFHQPVVSLRDFAWGIFADHYIELAKSRAYNQDGQFSKAEQESACWTLHRCLDLLLLAFAPVLPFITARIYRDMRGKDVHAEPFPEPKPQQHPSPSFTTEDLIALDSAIWQAKKQAGSSLRAPVLGGPEQGTLALPEQFQSLEADLRAAHAIGKDVQIAWEKIKAEDVRLLTKQE